MLHTTTGVGYHSPRGLKQEVHYPARRMERGPGFLVSPPEKVEGEERQQKQGERENIQFGEEKGG